MCIQINRARRQLRFTPEQGTSRLVAQGVGSRTAAKKPRRDPAEEEVVSDPVSEELQRQAGNFLVTSAFGQYMVEQITFHTRFILRYNIPLMYNRLTIPMLIKIVQELISDKPHISSIEGQVTLLILRENTVPRFFVCGHNTAVFKFVLNSRVVSAEVLHSYFLGVSDRIEDVINNSYENSSAAIVIPVSLQLFCKTH
jgi:hypothetical protein